MYRNKIKRIWKSKDVKVLIENFFSLSILQVIGLILPLVVLPYILRVLGAQEYGKVVFAYSLTLYFFSITDYSYRITGTRAVAKNRHSVRNLSLIYSEVITIRTLLCITSLCVISIVVLAVPTFRKDALLFALTAPILIGNVLFPEWFFQGIEKMKYITILNVGVKVFFTTCIFIFIKDPKDLWIYPLLNSSGYLGAGIISQFLITSKYKLKYSWIGRERIIKNLKKNFPIFTSQFIPTLYNNTSTFLLGILSSSEIVGIYDAIRKVTDILYVIIDVISRTFFPYIVRKRESFKAFAKWVNITGALLSLMPIVFYKLLVNILSISYENTFIVFIILSMGILFLTWSSVYGTNFLIARGYDKEVMKITILSSLIGFVLAFPLILYLGIIGAAITVTISRFALGTGALIRHKAHARKPLETQKQQTNDI